MLKLELITNAAATGTLTSDNTNVTLNDTVTIGTRVYKFKKEFATATLTTNNTQVTAGKKVMVGARVYTFKAALTEDGLHAGEVVIGADADTTLGNLVKAINHDAGSAGTAYDTATVAHEHCTAGAVGSHATLLTAKVAGALANTFITVSTDETTLSFGSEVTTFADGYDVTKDEIKIGANADASLGNLVAAINGTDTAYTANTQVSAGAVTAGHATVLTALLPGSAYNTVATTEASSHLSFAATTLGGGLGGNISALTIDSASTYYTAPIDVAPYKEMIGFLTVHSHVGATGTLDVKFQMSPDGVNWVDGDAFTQVTTADTVTIKRVTSIFGEYLRAVIVTAGTTPEYKISLAISAKP